MSSAGGRLPGLDGLRALAILCVILWHAQRVLDYPPGRLGVLRPLVLSGWAGVDLFFALSGFLITRLLLEEERRSKDADGRARFNLGRFYVRRALRILPPYYFVFLLNLLLLSRLAAVPSASWAWPETGGSAIFAVASLLAFFSNYATPTGAGLAYVVTWSLCVEEHFYLLWPSALRWIRRPGTRLWVAGLVCLLLPLWRWRAAAAGNLVQIHTLSHFRIDSILWGAATALGFAWIAHRRWLRWGALGASALAAAVLVARKDLGFAPFPTPLGAGLGLTLLALASAALVAQVAAAPESLLVRMLEWPPLRGVGRVSYGMYLLHFQAIDLGWAIAPRWLIRYPSSLRFACFAALFSLLSFALASLMHFLLERPALRLKERYAAPSGGRPRRAT
jgi:peptidoglycan/LPS O-acetylase OafA/YrhL